MIKFYNTLTKKVEEFKSIEPNKVKMYSCGPTVYSFAHIGNFRAYIFMDTLRRVLKYNGYTIDGVMNFTDVGHLVSDADEGEDKMEVAAKRENKTPLEISQFYGEYFLKDAKKLNIDLPERIVKATDHIKDMIEFVQCLIKNGYAYEVNGNVYYDVGKFNRYGMLSGINLENQKAGARIEVNSEKHSPYDFALWIKAPENHIMKWESPWGLGYPGWHIECSTMSRKYLGDTFDIHTGGVDHIPVHHENEIAQSMGLTGKLQANYWMHVEFLQVNNGKMGKSLGNCYTITELEEKGYEALDYRYFCLNANYSKILNFTFDGLTSARNARKRLYDLVLLHKNGSNTISQDVIEKYRLDFVNAINDDLNIPLAMGNLWSMLRQEKPSKQIYDLALDMDRVFGLDFDKVDKVKQDIPQKIKELAENRWQAKLQKNYALSDELRNKLLNFGYEILDRKDGYEIKAIDK